MKKCLYCLVAAFLFSGFAFAENQELVLEDNFERPELGKGWAAQFGDWKVVDGVLRAKQIPADNHGAAARRVLPMQDGIFEMKFRLTGEGKGFHFGFDPARGELDKKGHLFSIIVSPGKARVLKHVDKNKREEDPDETLASVDHQFAAGDWYHLRVEKKGTQVAAAIKAVAGEGASLTLEASHPTFSVKTPTLVFRCIGDGIEIDDIKVTRIAQ